MTIDSSADFNSVDKLQTDLFSNQISTVILTGKSRSVDIPSYCFQGCFTLTNFTIGPQIKINTIRPGAFSGTGLTSINLTNVVGMIWSYAFSYCPNLKEVIFPSESVYLGNGIFQGSGLTEVTLPSWFSCPHAFFCCPNLVKVTFNGNKQVAEAQFAESPVEELVGTETLFKLGPKCFQGTKIKEFIIPPFLEVFDRTVFENCDEIIFKFGCTRNPNFMITEHELISVPDFTLIQTFGKLPSTYVVSEFVKKLNFNSIKGKPLIEKGEKVDYGVTTLIIKGQVTFEYDRDLTKFSQKLPSLPYLYNFCYGGDFINQSNYFPEGFRIFASERFFSNSDLVTKGICDTSTPYNDYADGKINFNLKGIESNDYPKPFPIENGPDCGDNTTNETEPIEYTPDPTPSNDKEKHISSFSSALIVLSIIEIVVCVVLVLLIYLKCKSRTTNESSSGNSAEEAMANLLNQNNPDSISLDQDIHKSNDDEQTLLIRENK